MNTLFDNEFSQSTNIQKICDTLGCKVNTPGWTDMFGKALSEYINKDNVKKTNTLSLFSGAGGLDIGFHDLGFNIIESVEIEEKFCATLVLNSGEGRRFSSAKVNCIDIREYEGNDLGQIDFIIGGPPCQTFSAAGRRASGVLGTTDARGVLFKEYVRLLDKLQPVGFLFENVYGIIGAQNGQAWEDIKKSFTEVGYTLYSRILDAADYGVPQHRKRLIIIGLKEGEFLFPRPTHGQDSGNNIPFYNAGCAIDGLNLTEKEVQVGITGRFGSLISNIPSGLNYSFYTKEMGHPNPVFAWRSKFSDFMYKATKIPLYFLLFFSLVGCKGYLNDDSVPNYAGFVTSEIVVNVTPDTKSYRIEVEWTHEALENPYVTIDKEATTAKHNVHFVNTPVNWREIGEFLLPLEGKIVYKDVEVIPRGIDEKVIIVYLLDDYVFSSDEYEGEPLITELTVILQPKPQP